jgi:PAS domain S-box-containing protein
MGVVLIAFERESEQGAVEQLLAGRGHQVLKSANGLAALDAARREPPDLIISDIVLPRMDGFALCRKWKQDERLQSIPFVFYTRRHDDPKYERFALELGAERFLARSVQPEALGNAVDELLVGKPKTQAPIAPPPVGDASAAKRSHALDKDKQSLEQDKQALEKHKQSLEKEKQSLDKEKQALEKEKHALQSEKQALDNDKQAQAQELERAQQAHNSLRMRLGELEASNQRLAAGETRFRRVFEANPLPMWIADHATSGFIAVNDAALALYGYERSEFLGLKNAGLSAPEPSALEGVSLHRRKDGATLSVALAARDIEFDGRAADLVAAYDLSARVAAERRQHEQAQHELQQKLLRAQQELQEQIQQAQEQAQEQARAQLAQKASEDRLWFDAIADGCLLLDAEGKLVDANPAYCRLTGYDRDELLKMSAADIEDTGSGNDTMRLQMGRLHGGERYETKHRRKDGTLVDVEVSIGQLDAARANRVVVIRDVTQRRREQMAQRSSHRQLEHLVDLFKQSESLDESAIVRRAIEDAQEATASPLAYLLFIDGKEKTLTLAAMRDGREGQVVMSGSDAQPLARAGALLDCVRGKHAVVSNDVSRKQQLPGLPELQRYIGVPMIAGDEVVGLLGVANREGAYGDGDQRALVYLADGIARVLHARRSHVSTMRSLQRSDVAIQGMIDSFVRMIERHDPYTAGSSRRLAALAVAIGREAGLDGERQHALRVAALLHDIGNIAVPAAILAKPAPLTETEIALMRTHVEEGCQLLADIDLGGPIADIVYQSHERFDGSGYPRGLKGEEIMLEARILHIADTVEAMCSPRPYRPAAGMEAAINEINRAAGRLFDLQLVTACTRLIKERGFALPE